LTVTDAVGCQKDTIFKLVPLDITITNKIDSADCGKANGRIEIVTSSKIKSAVWQDNTTSLVRENLKAGRYALTLTDVNGCTKTFGFEVGEKDNCTCDFYTAISPNGDGKNDYFFIDCKKKGCSDDLKDCFKDNEVIIFNRWGNVVFKAEPYNNDWDAQGLPDGVYYYQFRKDPNSKVEKGSIIVKGN
jgi:gliding motility-associated-like protein